MIAINFTDDALWERIGGAVEKVKERLRRTSAILQDADIPYAVIGGNAVQAWVAQANPTAVRITRDVDILLRREDLDAAITAMESAGFRYRHVRGIDMFLDGDDVKARDGVHVIFAGERVRPDDPVPAPLVTESTRIGLDQTVSLEALVRMKLVSNRRKDQMHLLDMIDVELIDETWLDRLPPELAPRLQQLLDDPEG